MRIAVIGAGIVGAACAWALAARGAEVVVLERAPMPAAGATARSAAGIRQQFSHPVNVAMSRHSAAVFDAFATLTGGSADYRRVGYLFLVPPSLQAAWAAQRAMQRSLGARVERLDPQAIAARFPFVALDGVAEGSFGPDDGVLDPHAATLGFLAAARRRGARLRLNTTVTALEPHPRGWSVRFAPTGAPGAPDAPDAPRERPPAEERVDAVVNAAGPHAAAVGALAGLELPVVPSRRNVYATAPLPEACSPWLPTPLIVDLGSGVWLRSEGRRLIFGLSNPAEPAGFNEALDWLWLEHVLERALPRFRWLERAALDRRASWAGLYSVTPDHLPILGTPAALPRFANAVGFSGHGVQHAPASGLIVAEELLDGGAHTFDIADFRLERFRAGAPRPDARSPERNIV